MSSPADSRLQLPIMSRRDLLARSGLGLAGLALGQLGGLPAFAEPAAGVGSNPLLPKAPQFPAKAKHVIHLFMNGGPSHVDTFDPKPALDEISRASRCRWPTCPPSGRPVRLSPRPSSSRNTARAASRSANFFPAWER